MANRIRGSLGDVMAKKMDRIKVLNLSPEDLLWARLAESAFGFWDNPEDEIYDEL